MKQVRERQHITGTKQSPEAHESSQLAVSLRQEAAIDALVMGKADGEAAELAGVARETVNRWRNHDATFRAAIERRRREAWACYQDRIRALFGKALDAVEEALADPDRALAAVGHVAKLVHVEVGAPDGEIDPEAILRGEAEAWARVYMTEHGERRASALDALIGGLADEAEAWNAARLRELTAQRLAELRERQGD